MSFVFSAWFSLLQIRFLSFFFFFPFFYNSNSPVPRCTCLYIWWLSSFESHSSCLSMVWFKKPTIQRMPYNYAKLFTSFSSMVIEGDKPVTSISMSPEVSNNPILLVNVAKDRLFLYRSVRISFSIYIVFWLSVDQDLCKSGSVFPRNFY